MVKVTKNTFFEKKFGKKSASHTQIDSSSSRKFSKNTFFWRKMAIFLWNQCFLMKYDTFVRKKCRFPLKISKKVGKWPEFTAFSKRSTLVHTVRVVTRIRFLSQNNFILPKKLAESFSYSLCLLRYNSCFLSLALTKYWGSWLNWLKIVSSLI